MRDQRIKDLMKKFKQKEEELIRQGKKRHEEIRRSAQKIRLGIINEAEKRKKDLLRFNIDFQKKQEEKMKEIQRREKNRLNNLLNNIRINNNNNRDIFQMNRDLQNNNRRILSNILMAQHLRPNNNLIGDIINVNHSNNNQNNNNHNNIMNNEFKKIEKLLQDTKLTEEILSKIDNKQCLICLDDYKIEENICYLPCFHLFHSECIKSWVQKSNKCPLCKSVIKLD